MPALECQNGHLVTDQDAVRCPDCGSYVQSRRTGAAPYREYADPTAPWRLLFGSVGLAFCAGLVFVLFAGMDENFARVVAGLVLFGAVTMWLIGCVGIGVQVALRSDD